MAKVVPAFPFVKQLPQITQNLFHNFSMIYSGGEPVGLLADTNPAETETSDTKDTEKDVEKEADKSFKEECKMLPHESMISAIFNTDANRTLFHLYVFGKTRNHVDEIFRPPLV
ncbi:hypothetical protein KXQ82_03940 [Mucilaginibacter sp. HMF5004]|uniref:hypothetical protein n=1 Tax=Mucilaginibacter rivuli TaxID=2857527 RepID=UPI001C5F061F|nr:hypothetical protein [Mucilaginibacter rivuli]MBW4888846.1 hypothetical protein [Mucilaginibacter rivuli]